MHEKKAKPVLKKVTTRAKDHESQHKVMTQTKISKTQQEQQSKIPVVTIQEISKAEISKSVMEVKIPSSTEVKEDVQKLKTDEIKHQEKKQEEHVKIKEQKHTEPETTLPWSEHKEAFKKDKMPKEEGSKTPSLTTKRISKIPLTEQEHEKVVLKPLERPDKSKDEPMKKKEKTPTSTKIEEAVAPKPLTGISEHEEPELLTKAKRIPTENNEVEKSSYQLSQDQEKSKKDEKPDKEDKVQSQAKKTEKTTYLEAKPLTIKKGKHSLKYEEKEDVSLKPVERLKEDTKLEKISPKFEKPSDEKPSLTTMTKPKESPKEICKSSVLQKIGSPPEKTMKEEKEVEVMSTLSPKTEPIPLQKKSSAMASNRVLPKDLIETVTLKKVPISSQPKASQEPPEKEKIALIKELSPGAVKLQKIPTQQEELVFEGVEFEDEKKEDEEEETWGWELVPSENYEGEEFDITLVDGAIETTGGTGDKIGERETKTSPLVFHAFPGLQK